MFQTCNLFAEPNASFTLIYFPSKKTFLFKRALALSTVYLTSSKTNEREEIKCDVLNGNRAHQEKVSRLNELGSAHENFDV